MLEKNESNELPALEEWTKALEQMGQEFRDAVTLANKRFDWVISFMAMTDRYNFEILGRMVRNPTLQIDTVAVGCVGIQIQLVYNPIFVKALSDEELRWVLTHEVAHVVLHHITHRLPTDKKERKITNWAADLAINSLFQQYAGTAYPKAKETAVSKKSGKILTMAGEPWVLLPSNFGYPEKRSMEEYEQLLRIDIASGKVDMDDYAESGNDPQLDWHVGWGTNSAVSEQVRQWVQGIQSKSSWGNLGADAVQTILQAQKSEVPWNKILRHYYGLMMSKTKVSTFKRPSRRMWYPWAGKRFEGVDRKLVAIDTSGSIIEKDLDKFLAETNALAQVQPVDVITWDAGLTITKVIPWNKRPSKFDFRGRGGTNPQPVLDFAAKNHYKEVIMLTDGEFSKPKNPPRLQVLWVITPGGEIQHLSKGRVVAMKQMA
jgi:predicted metal-dependent peptidase